MLCGCLLIKEQNPERDAGKLTYVTFVSLRPRFVADSTFVGFKSVDTSQGAVARLSNNASLFLENCSLVNNTATESVGVIYLGKGSRAGPSRVAVSGGEFSGNTPKPLIAKHSSGTAYATPRLGVYDEFAQVNGNTLSLEEMPQGTFVTSEDEAFKRIQQVLYPIPPPPLSIFANHWTLELDS